MMTSDGLQLNSRCFNLTMSWLNLHERNQVATCSAKSAFDVTSMCEALRKRGGNKVFGDEKLPNYFDIQNVELTETQLEQLMTGQLVPSGRWCQPTGVTLAGFDQGLEERMDLTRELPEHLADVLSRLVVLLAQFNVTGPLEALVSRLPVDRIRVLDLAHCYNLTGRWVG